MDRDDVVEEVPTARGALPTRWQEREALVRRVGVGVLCLVLIAAAAGLFGPGTGRRTAGAGDLTVTYPTVTRPGLDSRIVVTIPPGRDSSRHVVRIDRTVLDDLGIETFHPQPSATRSRGGQVELEFEGAGSRATRVSLDGRVPTQLGAGARDGDISAVVDGDVQTVSTRTWVLP